MSFRYKNPVWPGYFADPFVLPWRGEYFAYGTGESLERRGTGETRAFAILHSRDLVTWTPRGGALVVPPGAEGRNFWAPEVAERDGRFFLYYSSAPADRDELHRLRVAVANHPEGPFHDEGVVLPETEGFCIDAHPFRDPRDGRWYLFFARDFFEDRAGTGLAVAPLADHMLRPAGSARTVLRANADWQVYERDRPLYGRTWDAWHTVEGPCVVAHEDRYYCFYSGGNWQTQEYGLSYGFATHPLGPWKHAPEPGPIVLRQIAGQVLGPGHNSHIVAPDGRTQLLVYHAWDPEKKARRMCLDPVMWTANGPRCVGPTTTEQRLP
ncbi:MAG TPA: glycoside hydrolase family 43 protein [Opitutaceae bacterium]|nr:glycoside hydrolase family 43 protein [Opitutaceae bacterium]